VAVSLAWYRDVLGFRVVQEWKKNGQLTGAEMKSAAVTFYINQDDWKQGRDRIKGQGIRLFVTTGPDIDGYADAIKDRGGVLAGEPASEWGVRAFAVNDPDGFKLTFMTPLS
jgi:catechol 2,3-dioxygenase-like lactoylglutathione lyase family enzyme